MLIVYFIDMNIIFDVKIIIKFNLNVLISFISLIGHNIDLY